MVKAHKKVKCGTCKKKFVPYHLFNQDYCSNNCRQKAFYLKFVEENGITPLTHYRRLKKAKLKRKKVKV